MLVLCVAVLPLALLPGRRILDDANNCGGNGLAALANTESHGGHCTPSYTKVRDTETAGGWRAIIFAIAVALGAGIVENKPRRANAIGWAVWTALAGVLVVGLMVDLDFFSQVEVLWPSRVVSFALGTILVLVLIATPIVVLVTRESPSDSFPVATGSTGSR